METIPSPVRPISDGAGRVSFPGASARATMAGLLGRAGNGSVRDADRALLACTTANTLDATRCDPVRFPPSRGAGRAVREDALAGVSRRLGTAVATESGLATCPNTRAGLFAVLAARVDPGDTVVLLDPDDVCGERISAFLGAAVRRVPLRPGPDAPAPDLDRLEAELRAGPRMFAFSHPNAATGGIYPRAVLERIAGFARRHHVAVLVDERYHDTASADREFVSLASLDGMQEHTVTLLGPSRGRSGDRPDAALAVGPRPIVEAVRDLQDLMGLHVPRRAGRELLGWLADDRPGRADEIAALRALAVDRLAALPWAGVPSRRGGAFLFPDVSALGLPDLQVAQALASRADVLVGPGYRFGPSGRGHFRICCAQEEDAWTAALGRMVGVLSDLYAARRDAG